MSFAQTSDPCARCGRTITVTVRDGNVEVQRSCRCHARGGSGGGGGGGWDVAGLLDACGAVLNATLSLTTLAGALFLIAAVGGTHRRIEALEARVSRHERTFVEHVRSNP